ncbi:uncharacterized protein N7503_006887 [Penicillium pulvis]|uniref:uncharacterized protein n=1 Tax=Penicillium pulvis TaxID=1562058 RepID=UPI002549AD72|nr:uncharacterized protein N7503_006887 [Penicillium pulvis]KAJ5797591.1 hypothetical protein N7503_006887 [Penicillium pulvis]
MVTTISVFVTKCLKQLNQLAQSEGLNQHKSEVSPGLWADELGRLRVWAANIGAHQTGQSSLDFRLRDSSSARRTLMRVLERLQRAIEDLQDILDGSKVTEEDSILDFSDSEADCEQPEVQSTYYDLRDTISSLFQVSMVIRRPAQYDRLVGTKRSDAVMFEPFDRDHVFNKFPSADATILRRLGLAISERRAIFRYRKRHRMKLAQGNDRVFNDLPDTMSNLMSETVATEFLESPERETSEYETRSIRSQTSYAQSMVQGNHGIGVPAPPEGSDNGAPFECPYCFVVISTSTSFDWYRHIFNDLMPYVCIAPICLPPHRLYRSRREWFEHLQYQHSMTAETSAEVSCPLCQSPSPPRRSLEKHLGRHLEELALFALPRSDQDKDEEEFDSLSSSPPLLEMPSPSAFASEDGHISMERLTEAIRSISKDLPNMVANGLDDVLREPFRFVSGNSESPQSSRSSAFADAGPSTKLMPEGGQNTAEVMQQFEPCISDLSTPASEYTHKDRPLDVDRQLTVNSTMSYSANNSMEDWITFKYTRDGMNMEYEIRTDIETINLDILSSDFKEKNYVYPPASAAIMNPEKQQAREARDVGSETFCGVLWMSGDI